MMMLWKCSTWYASNFGKLSSGHRTGKGQFSFQSQRNAMPKNAQTIAQLRISHASKAMLNILQARLQQYMNCELPDVQAGFGKSKELEIKLPTSTGSSKKQESSRKTSTSILLTTPNPLCRSQQTMENSERDGNTRQLHLSPEKPVCGSRSKS